MLLCVGAFAVLFLLRAQHHSGMSMSAAASARVGEWSFHPHHLLYPAMTGVLNTLLGGERLDPFVLGQLHNIAWALASLVSIYLIAEQVLQHRGAAVLVAMAAFASHGFWVYATQIEPYVPFLGCTSVIAATLIRNSDAPLRWPHMLLLGSMLAVGASFHQASVFILIPMAWWFWRHAGVRGLIRLAAMAAVAGIAVLGAYVWVFFATHPGQGIPDMIRWMLYYQIISDQSHGTLGLDDVYQRLKSFDYSYVQTYLVFSNDLAFKLDRVLLPLPMLFAVLWNGRQVWRAAPHAEIRLFLLIWLVSIGGFFFWWKADVYKFFIPTIAPMILLCGIAVHDLWDAARAGSWVRTAILAATGGLLLLMLGSNYLTSVRPLAASIGPVYALAAKLDDASPDECSVYAMRFMSSNLLYHFGQHIRPFNLMFRKHYYAPIDEDIYKAIEASDTFENESCAVIPLLFMSREYFAKRSEWAIGAYLEPEDWGLFIDWLLDVAADSETGALTANEFRVFEDAEGDAYVLIDRTARSRIASREALLARIDRTTAAHPGRLYTWDRLLELGEPRQLHFGYH
jgi:hypothetical protein